MKTQAERKSLALSSQGGHNVSCYPIHIIPSIWNFFSAFYTSLVGKIDVNYFIYVERILV